MLVRDPKKLSDFPEAEKVTGDYGDVESLDRAFSGVSSAFIVSGYAEPGERAKLHRNVFQAAQRAGVRYLTLCSESPGGNACGTQIDWKLGQCVFLFEQMGVNRRDFLFAYAALPEDALYTDPLPQTSFLRRSSSREPLHRSCQLP